MMLAACTFTAGLPQRTMRAMNIREKRLINLKRLAAQYHKGKLAAVAERAGLLALLTASPIKRVGGPK